MPGLQDAAFWIDSECIAQNDAREKSAQVAAMDKIYTGARFTAIILEDVELSTDDYDFLRRARRKTGHEVTRQLELVRRILRAR